MLSCRGPGTAVTIATDMNSTIAATAVLGSSSVEPDAVLPDSLPVDVPHVAVPNPNGSPTYEIEYIDQYDADEMVHKVEVV